MKLNLSPQTFKSHYRFNTSEATSDIEMRFLTMENEKFQFKEKPTDDIGLLTQGIYGEGFISAHDKYDKKNVTFL